MRAVSSAFVVFLFLVVWVGVACPGGGAQGSVRVENGSQWRSLSEKLAEVDFEPACTCCDIAYMETFRTNRLEYARTPEFVEAVRRVASGESRYSPAGVEGVPFTAWRVFALEMRRHSAGTASTAFGAPRYGTSSGVRSEKGGLRLLGDSTCRIPELIYLASLEYRSWPGHAGIRPIFPRLVSTAFAELDGRLTEKRLMAGALAKRAAAIRERIAAAERMDPGDCRPDDVVLAKSELEWACGEALDVRSSLKETESGFARAEKASNGLLARCAHGPVAEFRMSGER